MGSGVSASQIFICETALQEVKWVLSLGASCVTIDSVVVFALRIGVIFRSFTQDELVLLVSFAGRREVIMRTGIG